MNVDLQAKIPNNVNLGEDPVLQRALEHWHPQYMEWWRDMGPAGFQEDEIYLRTAIGVGKGTRVGLFLPSSRDWVVGWAAAGRVGALVMPFSTLYRAPELRTAARIGDVDTLGPLYEQLGDLLRRRFPGWTGYVLTGAPALARAQPSSRGAGVALT